MFQSKDPWEQSLAEEGSGNNMEPGKWRGWAELLGYYSARDGQLCKDCKRGSPMIWYMHLKDGDLPAFLGRITTWGDSGIKEREREAPTILQVRGERVSLDRGAAGEGDPDPVGLGCNLKTKKSLSKDSRVSSLLGSWIPRSTVRVRAKDS